MSIYSEISKRIGWEPKEVSIPTIEKAKDLYVKTHNGNPEAFEQVFMIHRFSKSPTTDEECQAMKWVYDAYKNGTVIFSKIADSEDFNN